MLCIMLCMAHRSKQSILEELYKQNTATTTFTKQPRGRLLGGNNLFRKQKHRKLYVACNEYNYELQFNMVPCVTTYINHGCYDALVGRLRQWSLYYLVFLRFHVLADFCIFH